MSEDHYCKGGEEWISLDKELNIFNTKTCEDLCKRQNVFGCCYLGATTGCSWKLGSRSSDQFTDGEKATSVTCYDGN